MARAKSVSAKTSRAERKSGRKPHARSATKDVVIPVSTWRYKMIALVFGTMFIGLTARAVHLQIIDNDYLQSQGDARYLRVQKEPPTRGMIAVSYTHLTLPTKA